MRTLRAAIFFCAFTASIAAQARDRNFSMFGGGGLSVAQVTTGGENKTASSFKAYGYLAEAGLTIPMGNTWGALLGGEFGQISAVNSLQSETYMETGKLDYYSVKLGIYVGQIGAGLGYRKNTLNIKSVSLDTDSFTESTYKGNTPFAFGNFSVDFSGRYRAAVEGQFMDAELQDATGNKIKYKEMSASVRVYIIFD